MFLLLEQELNVTDRSISARTKQGTEDGALLW